MKIKYGIFLCFMGELRIFLTSSDTAASTGESPFGNRNGTLNHSWSIGARKNFTLQYRCQQSP
jgi:hypothetical protein